MSCSTEIEGSTLQSESFQLERVFISSKGIACAKAQLVWKDEVVPGRSGRSAPSQKNEPSMRHILAVHMGSAELELVRIDLDSFIPSGNKRNLRTDCQSRRLVFVYPEHPDGSELETVDATFRDSDDCHAVVRKLQDLNFQLSNVKPAPDESNLRAGHGPSTFPRSISLQLLPLHTPSPPLAYYQSPGRGRPGLASGVTPYLRPRGPINLSPSFHETPKTTHPPSEGYCRPYSTDPMLRLRQESSREDVNSRLAELDSLGQSRMFERELPRRRRLPWDTRDKNPEGAPEGIEADHNAESGGPGVVARREPVRSAESIDHSIGREQSSRLSQRSNPLDADQVATTAVEDQFFTDKSGRKRKHAEIDNSQTCSEESPDEGSSKVTSLGDDAILTIIDIHARLLADAGALWDEAVDKCRTTIGLASSACEPDNRMNIWLKNGIEWVQRLDDLCAVAATDMRNQVLSTSHD